MLLDAYLSSGPPIADFAMANFWSCAYDFVLLSARRYVYYRHGDERALYDTSVFDALFGWLDRERFGWVCVNEHVARPLRQAGQDPLVLPPGVDFAAFRDAVPRLPARTKALRVLVEGPLDADFKRALPTLEMLRGIEGIEIVHMSADDAKAEQADFALGALPHDEVAGVYASCDVLVKLSRTESFSMPILEQFSARGTAVVSAFAGHETLAVDGQNALVVDLDNPFAQARERLLQLMANPLMLQGLRHEAQVTASAYDWTIIHRRFQDFILAMRSPSDEVQPLPIVRSYRTCMTETLAMWARDHAARNA